MARHKQKGLGLVGIVLIMAVLYFSGAGSWLWQRLERFGGDCYALATTSQVPRASLVCDGSGRIIHWLGQLPEQFEQGVDSLRQRFGFSGSMPDFSGIKDNISQGLMALGSNGSALRQRLQEGPSQLWSGDAASQLRASVDHYTIGVHYLNQGSSNQAVSWLQSGASAKDGYGLMSQLQLGNIYNKGAEGIAPDTTKARYYYAQARMSLQQLQASNAPQAQQLLQSLPMSASELQAKLN